MQKPVGTRFFPEDAQEVRQALGEDWHLVLDGKVATFVAGGNPAEIKAKIEKLSPVLVQVSPLTLEEVFLIEMEEKEYDFRDIV